MTKSTICSPKTIPGGRELDDLLTELDTAGVEILEEPKAEFDKKVEEAEEPGELDLVQELNDKTNDPVRMYLREMGSVPLLTREGEIELAKRIERGQAAVRKAISRSALVIREILAMPEMLREDPTVIRDVLIMPDLVVADEILPERAEELLAVIAEIDKNYRKAQQFRQKLQAISRSMKPKMHRTLRWSLARTMVVISRLIRGIQFTSGTRRALAGNLRNVVEQLRPIEREIARLQRKLETPANGANGASTFCARNSSSSASAFSNSKKNPAPPPPSSAAPCRSSNAASRKPRSPRSN